MKHTPHFRFVFDDVRPDAEHVEIVLGYEPGRSPGPVQEAIEKILTGPEDVWSIEGGYVVYERARLDATRHRLMVAGVTLEVGKIVARQLGRLEGVAVFLCTAGPGIEKLSRRLMSSRGALAAYVADTIGSLVVERAVDRIQDRLEAQLRANGLGVTNRFSPGHCGWSVVEQQTLFRLLPRGFCGVNLTKTGLMRPIKSVSGVIGCGRSARRQPYNCRLCDMNECPYRRLRTPYEAA